MHRKRSSYEIGAAWLLDALVWLVLLPWRILMVLLRLLVPVQGGTPVELVATPTSPLPLVLVGLTPGTATFDVANPLDHDLVLGDIDIELSGPAAAKATASTDSPINIAAGGTTSVVVTVTPTEPIFEGETLTVSVTAKE